MKFIFVLFCLCAFTFGQDETIEVPGSYCNMFRFGRSVHRLQPRHHCHRGNCAEGLYCVKKRCTKTCPIRKHKPRHHFAEY